MSTHLSKDAWKLIDAGVDVRPSTIGPAAGNGLFATVPIAKGEPITPYDGTMVNSLFVTKKEITAANINVSHLAKVPGSDRHIFGERYPFAMTGGASFANSCRSKMNAVFRVSNMPGLWEYDGNSSLVGGPGSSYPTLYIQASRDIAVDDEIFVSYNNETLKNMGLLEEMGAKVEV